MSQSGFRQCIREGILKGEQVGTLAGEVFCGKRISIQTMGATLRGKKKMKVLEKEDSPAIDSGSSIDVPSDDFDGNPGPQGAGYDVGAFEFMGTGVDVLSNGK